MIQELIIFKQKVDTSITNKALPGSILKTDVGGRFKDLADLLQFVIDTYNGAENIPVIADGSYIIKAGYLLEVIVIIPSGDITLKIGTTPGGEEIQPAEFLAANQPFVTTINTYAVNDKTIYFTGITADTVMKMYKR
jgi:hypothetical protein